MEGLGSVTIPQGFPDNVNEVIAGSVSILIGVAGLVFFAILIIGGFRYLTAGGDEKAAAEARKTLSNGFIGLIIIVASFLISQLLFAVFGLDTFIGVN